MPIAIVEDNYAYVVIDTASRKAVVVDPSDPHAVKVCVCCGYLHIAYCACVCVRVCV